MTQDRYQALAFALVCLVIGRVLVALFRILIGDGR
jgi:hypothetical protein